MSRTSHSTIGFSAQFGGQDAADAVLPHFFALKAVAKGIGFDSFPYTKLAFILRVDGEVHEYGFSGAGEPDIDRDGECLSIDIGITLEDRGDIPSTIKSSIMNSLPIIAAAVRSVGNNDFDVSRLKSPLELLCQRYSENLP